MGALASKKSDLISKVYHCENCLFNDSGAVLASRQVENGRMISTRAGESFYAKLNVHKTF